MRIGLQVPSFTWPGGPAEMRSRLADVARTADEAGFASLWVMDHYILSRYCDQVRRSYDDIERTSLGTVHLSTGNTTPAEVIELCRSLASIGIQHAIFNMPNVADIKPLETFGREIIPAVAGL